jgi:ATP-dependent DNA helicase PIF1
MEQNLSGDLVIKNDPIKEKLFEEIFINHRNIFLTGPGGTSKSYTVKEIKAKCLERNINIALTASTGVAALNIGGTTVHRFFGIGLGKGDIMKIIGLVKNKPAVIKEIIKTEILVIDEISMISAELLTIIDIVARYFKEKDKPFGDIQVIFVGDLYQLPPVEGDYCFKSKIWKELNLKLIELKEPKRFDDLDFFNTLSRARIGKLNDNDIKKLNKRVKKFSNYLKNKDTFTIKPTILYAHKKSVELENINELEKLPGKKYTYTAIDHILVKYDRKINIDHFKALFNQVLPDTLELKVGAQVMLTFNVNLELGLCNGSRGVIKELTETGANVLFLDGTQIFIDPIKIQIEERKNIAVRTQLPLILAYAITIHKSQGSTIDCAVIDIGPNIFAPGQAYVALSRARNWKSVYCSNFTENSFKCDKEVIEFYDSVNK